MLLVLYIVDIVVVAVVVSVVGVVGVGSIGGGVGSVGVVLIAVVGVVVFVVVVGYVVVDVAVVMVFAAVFVVCRLSHLLYFFASPKASSLSTLLRSCLPLTIFDSASRSLPPSLPTIFHQDGVVYWQHSLAGSGSARLLLRSRNQPLQL